LYQLKHWFDLYHRDEINLSSETENDQDVEREISKDKIVLLPEISNKIDGDVENEVSKDKIERHVQ
jgi:hypothetical protein